MKRDYSLLQFVIEVRKQGWEASGDYGQRRCSHMNTRLYNWQNAACTALEDVSILPVQYTVIYHKSP